MRIWELTPTIPFFTMLHFDQETKQEFFHHTGNLLQRINGRCKMLFHITQSHTPETCPKDEGGSKTLYNPKAKGAKLVAMYGAFSEHVIFYIVEAETLSAVNQFLYPGFKRCTCEITPIAEEAITV
jgi:hypothetical protein